MFAGERFATGCQAGIRRLTVPRTLAVNPAKINKGTYRNRLKRIGWRLEAINNDKYTLNPNCKAFAKLSDGLFFKACSIFFTGTTKSIKKPKAPRRPSAYQ